MFLRNIIRHKGWDVSCTIRLQKIVTSVLLAYSTALCLHTLEKQAAMWMRSGSEELGQPLGNSKGGTEAFNSRS